MAGPEQEPAIRVGILTRAREARFSLTGNFRTEAGDLIPGGDYTCRAEGEGVSLQGNASRSERAVRLVPENYQGCRIAVEDVTIGIDFHWERKESQQFQGSLEIQAAEGGLTLINELPVESYLVSVITSEMSASCPSELLRAHAIVSRSWLLAQLNARPIERRPPARSSAGPSVERIRWCDRESHTGFDVCADDHCQRYQGISKAFSESAFDAVRGTRGRVLLYDGEICDARYSKSCGGVTEVYSAAWEDIEVPYLVSVYDGAGELSGYGLPLSREENARAWITSLPPAYCNTRSEELLARILPGFDQETRDFYRWEVLYDQDELREILLARLGEDLGAVRSLEAVERGRSGRIIRLRITGENGSLVIGKELEVRRALSRTHLYSSALVARPVINDSEKYPSAFRLIGAGWGHGVGLCQIGAAVMADTGMGHEHILAHYFRGTKLRAIY